MKQKTGYGPKPKRLLIALHGTDKQAVDASTFIMENESRMSIGILILKGSAKAPKGSIALFTNGECKFRGTYLHVPMYRCVDKPEWAQDCCGVIILRKHFLKYNENIYRHALASAVQIGWRRMTRVPLLVVPKTVFVLNVCK